MSSSLGQTLEEWAEEKGIKEGLEKGIKKGMEQGVKKGMEQGVKKGMEQGVKKGMEQGVKKGMEQGVEKGRLETCREILCQLLELQFGALPEETRKRIDNTSDLSKLKSAIGQVQSLSSLDQLDL